MTTKETIKILSREKECVQQALQKCADGSGYVSPDGMIRAADYVEACSVALAALREQENPTSCNKVSNKEKMLESNRICSGCRWKGVRHQRCSCCCRNLYLKDNYEEEV